MRLGRTSKRLPRETIRSLLLDAATTDHRHARSCKDAICFARNEIRMRSRVLIRINLGTLRYHELPHALSWRAHAGGIQGRPLRLAAAAQVRSVPFQEGLREPQVTPTPGCLLTGTLERLGSTRRNSMTCQRGDVLPRTAHNSGTESRDPLPTGPQLHIETNDQNTNIRPRTNVIWPPAKHSPPSQLNSRPLRRLLLARLTPLSRINLTFLFSPAEPAA